MTPLAQQRCLHHATREAVARCPECAQFFCRECITEHDERIICASCLKKIAQAAAKPARRRVNLWPVVQVAAGLVVALLVFHTIGRVLLTMPDSFHDGTMWTHLVGGSDE
ncbi:MAG: rhomboid family protein [Chthoniobacter sp.]|nr:rhomboid family protein [Chthoniobacter sp.]